MTADQRLDPEGFTDDARKVAEGLMALGAEVETFAPGQATAWLHGHCFLIKPTGELVEL